MKKGLRRGSTGFPPSGRPSLVRIAALMKKGLRPARPVLHHGISHSTAVRIAALMKKGLRHLRPTAGLACRHDFVRIAALMKKGLRLQDFRPTAGLACRQVRIAALMKKGLRRREGQGDRRADTQSPNCCPDEEGIKTATVALTLRTSARRVRIAALMKKGLRRPAVRISRLMPFSLSELLP